MLFNSYMFVLAFLPMVLCVFYALLPYNKKWRIYWLIAASFVFYGWWNPPYVLLLFASIIVNFFLGQYIIKTRNKAVLIAGIAFNLGLIGYYKYALFFASLFLDYSNSQVTFEAIASPFLPLGISFFTFQQIAYLIDCRRQRVVTHNFSEYSLFVSFFPQLIAGPIVHQKNILPQLTKTHFELHSGKIALGLTLFIIGLSKKSLLADPLGNIATPLFNASQNNILGFADSWLAAFAYTLQLYFDFSGYSDMAIGLGLLFGITLPLNFYSPYKSLNIIDFWRRWHITLSRFLRDYLYIPLGGNQKGRTRRYINLMITMLLGGLWHGAGWTFIIWGGLHGLYLIINHAWKYTGIKMPKLLAWAITFMSVTLAWVIFRAESFESASNIYQGMILFNISGEMSLLNMLEWVTVGGSLIIAVIFPNAYEWLKKRRYNLSTDAWLPERFWTNALPVIGKWEPRYFLAICAGAALWLSLLTLQFVQSEFIYFNF